MTFSPNDPLRITCHICFFHLCGSSRQELVVSRLAYVHNIVQEVACFRGKVWRTYDQIFRSQAASDKSMDGTTTSLSLMVASSQRKPQVLYATKLTICCHHVLWLLYLLCTFIGPMQTIHQIINGPLTCHPSSWMGLPAMCVMV